MPNQQDILRDRRFWAVLYAETLGQIGEPPEPSIVYSMFAVSAKDAQDWFDGFTGWTSAVSDTVPAMIRVPLANGVELSIEFQLGDVNWCLCGLNQPEARLANIGGHWELPGLRWEEAAAIAAAAPNAAWIVMLLLLPVVWLTDGDDIRIVRSSVASAWIASALISPPSASILTDLWVGAVEGGRRYHWKQSESGWICNAHWSTRGEQREATEIAHINRVIAQAGGAA